MATRKEIEDLKLRSRQMLLDGDGIKNAIHQIQELNNFNDADFRAHMNLVYLLLSAKGFISAFRYQRPYRHMWE